MLNFDKSSCNLQICSNWISVYWMLDLNYHHLLYKSIITGNNIACLNHQKKFIFTRTLAMMLQFIPKLVHQKCKNSCCSEFCLASILSWKIWINTFFYSVKISIKGTFSLAHAQTTYIYSTTRKGNNLNPHAIVCL
jgi:hypothetical protein